MSCLFCRIIKKEIPCHKIFETEHSLAFLDIFPLSRGHSLVIPKVHAAKIHELSAESVRDCISVAHQVALSLVQKDGVTEYNILQNNGRLAHQEIDHVHFHIIPKPNNEEGLGITWPSSPANQEELKALAARLSQ